MPKKLNIAFKLPKAKDFRGVFSMGRSSVKSALGMAIKYIAKIGTINTGKRISAILAIGSTPCLIKYTVSNIWVIITNSLGVRCSINALITSAEI